MIRTRSQRIAARRYAERYNWQDPNPESFSPAVIWALVGLAFLIACI
jgi:hypothetical protein